MRDIGIASGREPDVRRDDSGRGVNLTFRGISDARSSVDWDTRIRIALASAQAVRVGDNASSARRFVVRSDRGRPMERILRRSLQARER